MTATARSKSFPPTTGGSATPTRSCASASSGTRPSSRFMTTTYDGIILGAGHNGLILQAYLGKAGLKTLAIERRPVAGGGLSTLEDPRHPGFLHNTHAFFQRAITAMPWYADLELDRHGARYIEPELNVALITGDGRALEWWTDIGKTIASFAQFSRRDADTLARWHDEFVPIVQHILAPEEQRRPPAHGGQRAVAGAVRRAGIRASHHPGGAALLQRAARGRSAVAGLRPSYRVAAGEPRQGADVARRLGGAGARARGGGARERRRDPADDGAGADHRRGRACRRC